MEKGDWGEEGECGGEDVPGPVLSGEEENKMSKAKTKTASSRIFTIADFELPCSYTFPLV